jgi:hypothetical protein
MIMRSKRRQLPRRLLDLLARSPVARSIMIRRLLQTIVVPVCWCLFQGTMAEAQTPCPSDAPCQPGTACITQECNCTCVPFTPTPVPLPTLTPIGCGNVCDGGYCEGRCSDGSVRGGNCSITTPNGCQCEPFECPGPCGIMVDPVPVVLTTPSVTLTGHGSFVGYAEVPVLISGGAQTVGFTFVPDHPFSIDVPLNPGLNHLLIDADASGPPGCHSEFRFDVMVTLATPTPTATPRVPLFCDPTPCPPGLACIIDPPFQSRVCACVGDCNDDYEASVDELVTMVNVALGNSTVSTCRFGDANGDGKITIDEILQAVTNALYGCGVTLPTPTPTPCVVGQCLSTLGYGCTGRACESAGHSTCDLNEFCDLSGQQCPCVVPTPAATSSPICAQTGDSCVRTTDCCSGACIVGSDGITLVCQ